MAKGTPIHVHLLDDPAVRRFAEVAQKVCDLFERVDDLPKVQFLQQLEELLPLAYSLAHRLPDPYDWPDDDDEDEQREPGWYEPGPKGMSGAERMARWKDLRSRITAKLSWHALVHFVYDPVSVDERQAISADLADLLADVYLDLEAGLILFAKPGEEERAQAIWDWRFHLGLGWGRHVAEALLPIHSLIHNHYDEDDEVFDI